MLQRQEEGIFGSIVLRNRKIHKGTAGRGRERKFSRQFYDKIRHLVHLSALGVGLAQSAAGRVLLVHPPVC